MARTFRRNPNAGDMARQARRYGYQQEASSSDGKGASVRCPLCRGRVVARYSGRSPIKALDSAMRDHLHYEHARNPKRDKRGFDAYTPDLFGGAHKERGEGTSKAEQMEFARQEMRDTGSHSLFDLLDEPKRKNPGDRVSGLTLGVLALAAVAMLHCGRHVVAMRQVGRPILPWGATWPLGSSTA
jgi:hypothetical protein